MAGPDAPGTSITVTDTQAGLDLKKPDSGKPVVSSTLNTGTAAVAQAYEVSGVEKSAIYKINTDNTVETLWTSKEENAYDLLVSGSDLVFVTDVQGRIYRLDRDRKTTLLAQADEGELAQPHLPAVAQA